MSENTPWLVMDDSTYLAKIAWRTRRPEQAIWDLAENQALWAQRRTRKFLLRGDLVYVPPPAPEKKGVKVEQANAYGGAVPKVTVTLVLQEDGKAQANRRYAVLTDLGAPARGALKTGADGSLTLDVPMDRYFVELALHDPYCRLRVFIGRASPVSTRVGQTVRLRQLGYLYAALEFDEGVSDLAFADAVRRLQRDAGLAVTGAVDDPTLNELDRRFGT